MLQARGRSTEELNRRLVDSRPPDKTRPEGVYVGEERRVQRVRHRDDIGVWWRRSLDDTHASITLLAAFGVISVFLLTRIAFIIITFT